MLNNSYSYRMISDTNTPDQGQEPSLEKNIILRDELPLSLAPISIAQATEALSSLDDYARMDIGVNAIGPRQVLEQFIREIAASRNPETQEPTSL